MGHPLLTIDDVAGMAHELPDVTDGERHGSRTWFVAGRAFAWERGFSKADIRRFGDEAPPDGPIVAVRTADLSAKAGVLEAGLPGFFTIPHFDGFPGVLIQLRLATRRSVHDALAQGWAACASAPPLRPRARRSARRPG